MLLSLDPWGNEMGTVDKNLSAWSSLNFLFTREFLHQSSASLFGAQGTALITNPIQFATKENYIAVNGTVFLQVFVNTLPLLG